MSKSFAKLTQEKGGKKTQQVEKMKARTGGRAIFTSLLSYLFCILATGRGVQK